MRSCALEDVFHLGVLLDMFCQISVVLYWKHVLLLDSWKDCFQNAFWCPTADFNFYKIALVLGYAGNSCKVCKKWWLLSNRSPEHILTGACSESDWFLIDFILSFFMFRQWTWHGPGMGINADAQRLGSSLRLSQFIVSKPTSAKRNLLISEENWYLLSDENLISQIWCCCFITQEMPSSCPQMFPFFKTLMWRAGQIL